MQRMHGNLCYTFWWVHPQINNPTLWCICFKGWAWCKRGMSRRISLRMYESRRITDYKQRISVSPSGCQSTSTRILTAISGHDWCLFKHKIAISPCQELKMDLVECLNFLFQLGSLELGQSYSVDALTPTQKQMLDDLKNIGVVYQRKVVFLDCWSRQKKSSRFYPTRLATSLINATTSDASKPDNQEGFIIIETNYRLYAYTSTYSVISDPW